MAEIRALALNCTLTKSPEPSSTELLTTQIPQALTDLGAQTAQVRVIDENVAPGVQKDMGEGDGWPRIREQVLASDILVLCTPIWMGHMSSVAQGVLERLDALLRRLEIEKSLLVRMTGCPNGCARPYMAEIGLVGSGVNQYQLWLGGTPNLQRLAQPFLQRMPLDDLETTLEPLFISWKEAGGRRSLGDHVQKLGDQAVAELLGAPA